MAKLPAKPPISPILISDKATVAFSAEGGKIRCVYPSWEAPRVALDGEDLLDVCPWG
jgi:hypothetical protein